MEVWDYDDLNADERIDNFTLPMSSPLNKFNLSDSLTVQGHHRVVNLTLSYGNLTGDPTQCNSMDSPLPTTATSNSMNSPLSSSAASNSVDSPLSSTAASNSMDSLLCSTATNNSLNSPLPSTATSNSIDSPLPRTSTQTYQGMYYTQVRMKVL